MPDCPIFNTVDAVSAVWAEAERLSNAVPEAFEPRGLHVESADYDEGTEDPMACYGYHYRVRNAVPRRRRLQQFLLMFDLCRAGSSNWEQARAALLTFAYHPLYDEGWEAAEVVVGSEGWPSNEEIRQDSTLDESGRLVEWGEEGGPWNRRSWFFSVPLIEISDRDAFSRHVVDPVAQLLRQDDASPAQVFEGTSAVAFAQWPT